MFTEIGEKLFSIVDGISAINSIYNYGAKGGDGGYPLATITPSNTKEVIMTTIQNEVEIAYDITVIVRNEDIVTNEATIRSIVDSLLIELRSDYTLTGTANNSRFEIERGYSNDEQPTRIAIIKCIYTLCIII